MSGILSPGFWLQFAAALCFAGVIGALLHGGALFAFGFLFLGVCLAGLGSVMVEQEERHAGIDAPGLSNSKGEQ